MVKGKRLSTVWPLAQSVEQRSINLEVMASIPTQVEDFFFASCGVLFSY